MKELKFEKLELAQKGGLSEFWIYSQMGCVTTKISFLSNKPAQIATFPFC